MFPLIRLIRLLIIGGLLSAGSAFADDRDTVIAELRQQIAQLAERLSALEDGANVVKPVCCKDTVRPDINWSDRFKFTGDLRYRYEGIDDDRQSTTRNRQRVRARAAVVAQVNDAFEVGIGIASGGDDPRSSNQTFGGGGSTKDLRLDLAYLGWQLTDTLSITAGKMQNPFHRAGSHPLVWDSDYRPEGVSIKFDNGRGFYLTGLADLLESDNQSANGDAETGWGLQSGFRHKLGADAQLHAGGSYYHYSVSGSRPFFDNKAFGNSLAANGTYMFDYEVVEAFAEFSFDVHSLPMSLFVNLVNNQDVSRNDTGWVVGANIGKASAQGSWELGYRYQGLEADAWFGLPTDSDFGGGGVDTKGHVFTAGYSLNRNAAVNLTYILSEYGRVSRGVSYDYDRLQMDLSLKF